MNGTELSNRVGLVLGGGGARGFAHIGVMRVLEREGFQPYCFAGTSMGGLLGAFYAAGMNSTELEALIEKLQLVRFLDLNPLAEALNRLELRRLLEQHLPETFAELPHPFCVTATDLISGKGVYFSDGNLADALLCTIAYPGAVDPSWVGDQLLADGGIVNQVPMGAVRVLGARQVLAVDVTPLEALSLTPQDKPARWWERMLGRDRQLSTIQALLRATDIMQAQITRSRMALVDPEAVIQVDMPGLTIFSFNRMQQAIAAGEAAAEAHLEQLRRVFTGALQTQT